MDGDGTSCGPADEKLGTAGRAPAIRVGRRRVSVEALLIAVVLIVQACSYLPRLTGEFRFNALNPHDSMFYVCLGHSLAHGRGYTRSLDPAHYVPHVTWPPGVPALVALSYAAVGSLLLAHGAIAAAALVNTLLYWLLFRRFVRSWRLRVFAVVCMVFSPVYDRLATVVMAEQPMILTLLASFICLDRFARGGYRLGGWAVGAAAAIGAGLLFKPSWLPLLAAFGLWALLDRRGGRTWWRRGVRAAAVLAVGVLPWGLWLARCAATPPGPGWDGSGQFGALVRGDQLAGDPLGPMAFAHTAWDNLKWYAAPRILDAFFGAGWSLREHLGWSPPPAAMMGVIALFALCWLATAWRFGGRGFLALATLLIPATFLLKNNGGAARYWLAWTPLALAVILVAVEAAHARLLRGAAWARAAGGVAMAALTLAAGAALVYDHTRRVPQGKPQYMAYVELIEQVKLRTPPGAVLLGDFVRPARLLADRPSHPTEEDFAALSGKRPPRRDLYAVVLNPPPGEPVDWGKQIGRERPPGEAVVVASNAFYTLYRLLPPPATTATAPAE